MLSSTFNFQQIHTTTQNDKINSSPSNKFLFLPLLIFSLRFFLSRPFGFGIFLDLPLTYDPAMAEPGRFPLLLAKLISESEADGNTLLLICPLLPNLTKIWGCLFPRIIQFKSFLCVLLFPFFLNFIFLRKQEKAILPKPVACNHH